MKRIITFFAAFSLSFSVAFAADIFNLTDTWTVGGTTYDAIKMVVTDTASAADSRLINVTASSGGIFQVNKDGTITMTGTQFIAEQADAGADVAGYGQVWVNTAAPNELWFTDDDGTDFQLGVAETFTSVVQDTTPVLGGELSNGGFDYVMTEVADHSSTPAAGFGYLWTQSTAPSTLMFTDDAGTDFDLTAGGGWNVEDTTNGNYGHGLNALDSITVGSGLDNIAIGENAGTALTTGDEYVIIGNDAGLASTGASGAVLIGRSAGTLAAATGITAVGFEAFRIGTGANNTIVGYQAGDALTTGHSNVFMGKHAGTASTTGVEQVGIGMNALDSTGAGSHRNVAVGFNAGQALTTQDDNVFIGHEAGLNATSSSAVYIGSEAGSGTGSATVAIGYRAGQTASSNNYSIMIGNQAGNDADASEQVLIGKFAGIASDGTLNTVVGSAAGQGLTTGAANTLYGANAGDNITTGGGNIVIGYLVDAPSATVSRQIEIGSRAAVATITGSMGTYLDEDVSALNTTINGPSALASAVTNLDAGDLILNGGAAATTGIGIGGDAILRGGAPGATGTGGKAIIQDSADNTKQIAWDVTGLTTATTRTITMPDADVTLGSSTWNVENTTDDNYAHGLAALDSVLGTGLANISIGTNAGTAITSGDNNTVVGNEAGAGHTAGTDNTHIGYEAGGSTADANYTTFIGSNAGKGATGSNSVFIGYNAGSGAGARNDDVAIGAQAMLVATDTRRTVAIGYQAADDLTTGNDNISIGKGSGVGLTGAFNIAIGTAVNVPSTTLSDQIEIGNQDTSDVSVINGSMGARSDLDYSGKTLTITGPSAYQAASTNKNGGTLALNGGLKMTGGLTGDVVINNMATVKEQTSTATSGSIRAFSVEPTYNQASGTAANSDVYIDRTETALGSGAQYLIEGNVGGSPMFLADNAGTVTAYGSVFAGNTTLTVDNLFGLGALTSTVPYLLWDTGDYVQYNRAIDYLTFVVGSGAALNISATTVNVPTNLTVTGTSYITEQAAANADVAGDGQIWVKSDAPNTLWFTDDAGTDVEVAAADGLIAHPLNAGLTAHVGSSQGDGPITFTYNEYATVGTTGDAATLPTAVAGIKVTVMNNGANSMDVFPASGDNAGGGVDTAVALAAGNNITYFAIDTTNWETL